MGARILARVAVAFGVSAVLATGFGAATAAAAPEPVEVRAVATARAVVPPSEALAVATVDAGVRGIGVTFNHDLTVLMYAAATSGTLEVVCATIPAPSLNWACEQVAQYAQEVFAGLGAPKDNQCLRVEPKIGWPPILPFYVKC